MATGLADLPVALATGARPFTKAADALGEATGFQPGKWADETKFSDGYQQGKKAVDDAWKDGSAGDIALAYLKNPGYTANQVAESVPGMVAGGLAGRALMGAGRIAAPLAEAGGGPGAPSLLARAVGEKWAAPVAAGLGEGTVTAGQQMADAKAEDQQKNAVAALGAGVVTGALGVGAGRVANKLGLETAETAIAKAGTGATTEVPLSAKRRILGGMVSEAVLQELPQSAQEQMWQNYAEGKPLMEGVARAATEGAIAGGVMGAGANVRGRPVAAQEPAATASEEDAAAPLQLGHSPDPLIVFPDGTTGRRADVEAYLASLPEDQQMAERSRLYGYAPQQAEVSTSPGASDGAGVQREAVIPPAALDATTSPGAGQQPGNEVDFTRDVDTSGLSLVDPVEQERARAATIDYQPGDTTPQWDTAPGAAPQRSGLDMPVREFDTGSLSVDTRAPSERMGIDPSAGPLSRGAARSVDSAPQAMAPAAQEIANAQATSARPAVQAQATPIPAARSSAMEAAGSGPLTTTTEGSIREPQATQAQQAIPQPAPTGAAQAAEPIPAGASAQAAVGAPAPGTLTHGAQALDNGAARHATPTSQGQAQGRQVAAEVATRPSNWRTSMLGAGPVAKGLGIDTRGKRTAQVVAEIDALDAARTAANTGEGNAATAPVVRMGDERTPGAAPVAQAGAGGQAGRAADAQPDARGTSGRGGASAPVGGMQPAVPGGSGAGQQATSVAPQGREVSRDIGRHKEGMSEFRANQVRSELARRNPGVSYTVEEDASLKNGFAVVGRESAQGGTTRRRADAMTPELARALMALRPPQAATKDSVRAAVDEVVNGMGMLPNRLGRVVVATAAEIKRDWEPIIGPAGMEASGEAGQAQGFYDPNTKTVFLIADHIKAGEELGVVAHELMHKHGQAVLGEEGWNQLHAAIGAWANAPEGSMERRVYDEAAARVQASGPELSTQELFPYAVQVALELGVRPNGLAPQGSVARWLAQVRSMLRQVWNKIAGQNGDFNSLDLVNLAFGIAQRENPEHAGELDGAITGVRREIRAVIDAARSPGHAPQKAVLGQVAGWLVQSAAAQGMNVEGFRHVLDGSAVRHMIKNHYEAKGEKSRGQIPLTDADLMALPAVVQNPERVVLGTKNRLGKEQIAYIKQMPDGSTLYLEEVRTGRKELAAVTARKYPATMNIESIVSTLHPNAQGDGGNGVIVLRTPAGSNNATAGPMYSRAAAAPTTGDYTPNQASAAERAFGVQTKETLVDRANAMRHNLGTKLRQGLVDQFAPIKEVSEKAYILARLSKGSDGAVEAALLYGKPYLRDGVADVDIKDGGFAKVLASLKGEDTRFFQWVAAQRAERLKAEGRENLLTDQDIAALKTLNAGRFADGTARMPAYAAALRELNAFNEATLKVAMESGLIDQAAYDMMKDQPYVPFYRLMEEDGGMNGPRFSSGLVNQQAWKKLKGGTQQINADLLQNTLMNWSHLYAAAARNRASLETMAAAEKMGIAYQVSADTKGAVKVMRDGVAEHWAVEDPYLLDAISAMSYSPPGIVKAMAPFKRLLTFGVTVNPTFKIRNLIRDSLSAIAQSDLSYNPAENVAKGWKATSKESQTYASMLASGGIIKFGTQENTDRVRAQIEKLGDQVLDKQGFDKLKGQMQSLWEAYEEFGDRTENVNRAALYERLIAKGHSHAEAAFMARDLMDFSMSGKWETVRFLAQTVPFLNARLQGLYKLGRAAKEDPRRFATMAGAVSLASLGLLAAYSDDDDWKKREDWDRDNYWWFKIGDKAFRVPKPFEVGAIGTVAERTAELMLDKEMTGKRFGQRISDMVFNTFAMDPTPQFIKPFIDVYANKDSFSGRPIEGMADEKLRPQDRYNERTSEAAKLLGSWGLPDPVRLAKGEYSGLSPKQIDFLLRGYFGWLATVATTATDTIARPALDRGERPAMRLRDTFFAGNFVESLPSGSIRYVSQMYEQAKEVEQAWASYQAAMKSGDTEKAREIQQDEAPKLRNRLAVANAKQQIAELGQQAKKIEGNRLMSADAKRERLDEIEARKSVIAQRVAVMN
ncbi:MAG: hypothetical protein J7556_15085 [Acidovorax sp.]|nr:hypothetical protein [Acidovorax sp.]